jgi:8-oxo-dGTP pyrophosphatase MutT (NUDIX family)
MPLDKSGTKEAFGKNVETEEHAGKSQKQAVAIAYATAGDSATAAGIVFHANSKVFMMQRPNGEWGFPAGTIESGETPEQAARRELIEETGYAHQGDLSSIGIFDGFFHAYFADVEPFNAVLNDEHIGAGWFRLDELPTPLHGCSGNVLACVFNATALGLDADEDTARNWDINGFFEVMDNPLSKVGVFQYLGKNIPQEKARGNGTKFFAVYRPAEELADPACIASFRLVPWIIDHTMIGNGTNGTKQIEDKGARGVTGERIWFDPKDDFGTLKGNIKCFSDFLAQSIAAGKTPLSLGYRCVYEYAPGSFNGVPYTYVQRRIRGNHLATVDDGRMGPEVAVMDGSELTLMEKSKMSNKTRDALLKAKQKTIVGAARARMMAFAMDAEEKIAAGEDGDGELAAAVKAISDVAPLLEAVEELKCVGESDVMATGDTMQSPGDERTKGGNGLDKEEDEEDEKDKPKDGEGMDAAEVTRIVNRAVKQAVQTALAGVGRGMDANDVVHTIAQRDVLAKQVSEFVGTFDASEKTAQQVAEYAVTELNIPAKKGGEIDAVKAFMHGRIAPRNLPIAHAGDSSDRGNKPSFLAAQLDARK